MAKKIEDKYKVLDHISHVLLRPQTYLGSNQPHESIRWVIESGKFIQKTITHVPSFLKIFDEVIVNSIDESKRNSKLNRIDVDINRDINLISIKDNGGIEVVIHKDQKKYVPEVIFGILMSGSNYSDEEERSWSGVNGLGAKCTNIFSKEFTVSTCDGKNSFLQVFSNNMSSRTKPEIKKSAKRHTEISFIPDLIRFGLDRIDDDHFKMIEKRVYDVAACNPNLKVYFNGELIHIKSFDDYIKLYMDEYFYESKNDKSWSVGIGLSQNGFQQVSFVNSTDTYDGGSHVDYIMNQIISHLREFFSKKHKVDIKPSEIKSHMFLFLNSTIINPSFSSQTKEKLITEVKDFGSTFEITNKLIQSILKSEIVNSILDWINQKKLADESKLFRTLKAKVKVDKLIDCQSSNRKDCELFIMEGLSALGDFRKYRNPGNQAAYSLRGKFTNTNGMSNKKILENEEAKNLILSIGLDLINAENMDNIRYGKIIICTDIDTDGDSICGLLLNFFSKWPKLIDNGLLHRAMAPLLVAKSLTKKNDNKYFYSMDEYETWIKTNNIRSYEIDYKKGLGSLETEEFKVLVQETKLVKFVENDLNELTTWFGEESILRKNKLL